MLNEVLSEVLSKITYMWGYRELYTIRQTYWNFYNWEFENLKIKEWSCKSPCLYNSENLSFVGMFQPLTPWFVHSWFPWVDNSLSRIGKTDVSSMTSIGDSYDGDSYREW